MLSYLTFFAVIVGASGFHGPTCVKCNQARDDEATCNYQMGSPGTVECDPGEVCTTDVRCDGQQRLFFIKGCQKHPTEMDTRICNPEHTRCHYHCDTDMCNKYVPANVISALVCTPTPTPEPMGPWCTKCNQARDSEEKCNTQPGMDGNMVQCSPDQVCTTDVRCDGQGRLFFIKGCENKSGITKYDELICNPTDTRCHFHCTDGDFCNENAPPAVWESLVCYDECELVPSDICLALDMSESINPSNWYRLLSWVQTLVQGLPIGEDATHVGIVRFAGAQDTHKDADMTINEKAYLVTLISGLPHEPTSPEKRTDLGIAACREIFEDNGRPKAQSYIVIFTDGAPSEPELAEEEMQQLIDMGTKCIVVAISGIRREAREDPCTILVVDSFDDLNTLRAVLTEETCGPP